MCGLLGIINYKDIYRKSNNEFGEYKIENNILIIFWEKWESESFYDLNNNSMNYF